jgi:hypothetical protein
LHYVRINLTNASIFLNNAQQTPMHYTAISMKWSGIEAMKLPDGGVQLLLRTELDEKDLYSEVAKVIVHFRRDADHERPILQSVTVDVSRSADPPQSSEFRLLQWDRLLRAAETIYDTPMPDFFLGEGEWREAQEQYLQAWAEYHSKVQAAVGHPGRGGRDRSHYKHIAALYKALLADGETKPIKRLSEDLGVNANTISGWVRKARKLGYLQATTRGKVG